jgi:hypothetical protein
MGASPVIVGDQLILACDQSIGSFLLSVDKNTGKEKWRTPRPEAKSGHATPILWRAPDGKDQILVPGSFLLTAYDAMTGEKRWWVRGLSFEIKSTPVIHGDTIYINGTAPENDPGHRPVPPSAEVPGGDVDKNGLISSGVPEYSAARWRLNSITLTKDEGMDSEWHVGDSPGRHRRHHQAMRWKYQRAVPQLPSPVVREHSTWSTMADCDDPESGDQ